MNLIQQEENWEREINLRNYLRVIRKRKRVIFFIFLIVVISVTTHTFKIRPEYRAVVRLLIGKENPNIVSFDEVLSIDGRSAEYYQTQFKIIKSRSIIDKVIKQLNLEKEFDELQEKEKKTKSLSDALSAFTKSVIHSLESVLKKDQELPNLDYKTDPAMISDATDRKAELLYRETIKPLTVKPIAG